MFILLTPLMFSSCKEKKIPASEVPQAVVTGLSAKYPGTKDIEWRTETENGNKIYEAEFQLNGKKIEAQFDANGNFIKDE